MPCYKCGCYDCICEDEEDCEHEWEYIKCEDLPPYCEIYYMKCKLCGATKEDDRCC